MKVLKFFLFIFKWNFIYKKHLVKVLKPYLLENGEIKISYSRKYLLVKNYNANFIQNESTITEYLNKSFEYFKVDHIKYKITNVKLSSSTLPIEFKLKKYRPRPFVIPLAIDENKKVIELETFTNSTALICCTSGTGKSFFLHSLLKRIIQLDFCRFDQVIIIDPKKEDEFIDFSNNKKIRIIQTFDECYQFYKDLEFAVDNGNNQSTLIIFEEYLQFLRPTQENDDKKRKKDLLRILEKGIEFMRSKRVCQIITTQHYTAEENLLSLSAINCKIYSSPSKSFCQLNNIPLVFANRPDLIHGKFLIQIRGKVFLGRF